MRGNAVLPTPASTEADTTASVQIYVAPRTHFNDGKGVNNWRGVLVTEHKTCTHLYPVNLTPLENRGKISNLAFLACLLSYMYEQNVPSQ
jgi:hypothetical protein